MRCIRCQTDSKKKDRAGGRCPSCRHEFAFDPQAGGVVTDAAFQKSIDVVSGGGRIRWGVENLQYEVCRRTKRLTRKQLFGCLGVAGGAVLFATAVLAFMLVSKGSSAAGCLIPWAGLMIAATVAAVVVHRKSGPFAPISRQKFEEMWTRWKQVHGEPPGVIVRPKPMPRQRAVEPDIADYSFDRAVICDRPRTVDLLLANNFHFENNCAVLAIGGYPEGPFETVRTMLRRNPRLQVFALHDATPQGCRMAFDLAHDASWFKGMRVVDVGLRPGHGGPFAGVYLPAATPVAEGNGIAAAEAAWLSKYMLELAAIRPEQTLKRLFRAINGQAGQADDGVAGGDGGSSGGGDSGGGVSYDSDSFGSDAGAADGGADSFG